MSHQAPRGKVYLVGGGPGDPGLLTLKARALLSRCDVVLFDYLIDQAILDFVPPGVERVYVGKSGAHKGADARQKQIGELLLEYAGEGKTVVRLKGGDPFVFGRGGEEIEVLREAGVPFEVVPGVSSSLAVPAYAEIPVTHRNYNTALAIVTGHEDPRLPDSRTNWKALASFAAAGGTLVVMMGVKNLRRNMSFLLEEGVSPEMPVAMVRWGTTHRQKTLIDTVSGIADRVDRESFRPPAVCVVGPVVGFREDSSWFQRSSLAGMRVLVTRAAEQSQNTCQMLRALGAVPRLLPTLEIVPAGNPAEHEDLLRRLQPGEWIALTSANGVRALFEALDRMDLDSRALARVKIACVGKSTAQVLREHGIRADFVPTKARARALARELLLHEDRPRVLAWLAAGARPDLVDVLSKGGADLRVAHVYRSAIPSQADPVILDELKEGRIGAILLASPSAVRGMEAFLGQGALPEAFQGALVVCIGDVTARAAREAGLQVDLVPDVASTEAMIEALYARVSRGETVSPAEK